MSEYKSLYKYEEFGSIGLGIEVLVKIDRTLSEVDEQAASTLVYTLKEALAKESMKLDPEANEQARKEKEELLGLFGEDKIFVEEIPNGYCNQACCSLRPWFIVTTKKGRITVGWRKRVIQISWQVLVAPKAEAVFPDEDVTKFDYAIHAWGLEKAKQYIGVLLEKK